MKKCKKCGLEKPFEEFHIDSKMKDGYKSICKNCRSDKKIDWKKKSINRKIAKYLWQKITFKIRKYLKDGPKKSFFEDTVGCSVENFVEHIEKQFKEEMDWKNYGRNGWEFDHIKPQSSFNLLDGEEVKKCYNYKNIQPLWKKENSRKNAKK